MTTIIGTGVYVTLDESAGLQNLTATPNPAGDADDNDILLASLPSAFSTLGAGTPMEAALSGYTGAAGNTGSNAFTITPAPGGSVTDIGFVGSDGAPLNGTPSGLFTLDGTEILLYTDTNNNILLGKAGSTIVFAAYIEETGTPVSGGKIWTVLYQPLKHTDANDHDYAVDLTGKVFIGTSQDLEFSLANAPSGQNLFLMFTTATPQTETVDGVVRISDPTIIATGKDPANQSTGVNINTGDTINTSQAGGPTTFGTNNQMITEQEGIRFTFVTGARQDVTIPNLSQSEAKVEANIDFEAMFNSRGADFDVVQLQSGKTAQVRISAFSTAAEPGVDFIDGYGDDDPVAISSVKVFNISTGQEITTGITIEIEDGVAFITGVKAGYRIEYTTSADHNRVLIENGAALDARGNDHADFDIGGFTLRQISTASTEIGSKMVFEDDGPSITASANAVPTLTTDDTDIPDSAGPTSFAGLFTPDFGEDGFKDADNNDVEDADAITYALGVSAPNGVDSGLRDTLSGDKIFLFLESGAVVGRVGTDGGAADPAGVVALTISVVANTGSVSLAQTRSIVHDDPADPIESGASAAGLAAASLVTLTATITDGDGDTATATRNIGGAFKFEDDGPSISANTVAVPTLTTDDTDIPDTAGPTSFAGLFTSDFGKDGFKDSDDNDVEDADAITYTLGVSAPNGVDSGLRDTLSGDKIFLFLESGAVVGRVGTSGDLANPAGTEAFRISVVVNTGSVSLSQSRSIVHDDPADPIESGASAAGLTADLVTLTATITDGDGDTATATRNIGGAFKFEDDGPSISANTVAVPTLTTDDTDIPDTAGPTSFAGLFTSDFGKDGFKDSDDNDVEDADAITYTLGVSAAGGVDSGLVDTLTGRKIYLFQQNSEVVGRVGTAGGLADAAGAVAFTISVVANTGNVTLTQTRSVVHDNPLDPVESGASAAVLAAASLVTLTATITDGDGDTATATRDIGDAFKFEDDGPTLAFGNLIGTGTILAQYGYWNMAAGTDGLGTTGLDITLVNNQFTLVRPDGTTTTGTGTLTEQSPSPDGNGAYQFAGTLSGDFDNNPNTDDPDVDFTLTAFADGTYALDLVQGFSSTVVLSSANGSLDAGGPDPVRTLTIGSEEIVFFTANPLAPPTGANSILTGIGLGAPDPTEAELQTTPLPPYIGTASMNVSTAGIGLANNNFDGNTTAGINAGDESFVINPETLLTGMKVFIDNSVGGYNTATEELYYRIFYADGSYSEQILVGAADLTAEAGGQVSFLIEREGTVMIDAVQLTMGKGTVKIPVIQFIQETEDLASDILLTFSATLTDGDGDTATSTFDANLFANEVAAEALFDYSLVGTLGERDAFNIDLSGTENRYEVTGFDANASPGLRDTLVLIGDPNAGDPQINYSGADSIVTVAESGGQTTTITVVGVVLDINDIVIA